MSTGILGGVFDPPHNGHVALARDAIDHFGLSRLVVLVADRPGHKEVATPGRIRVRLAEAAFGDIPEAEVVLDRHPRTVDALADGRFGADVFIVGADEFADFLSWKDPEGVLAAVRLGVATRPGYRRAELGRVLRHLERRDRVEFFEIEPVAVSSSGLRGRFSRGESPGGLVPPAVVELIDELGLYRS